MYIIYIKDTPLFITEPQLLSKNHLVTLVDESDASMQIKKILDGKANTPLLIETTSPHLQLQQLCEKLHYIEAAGGLVKNQFDQFLFIYRLGKWDLPKGKLEKNESIVDCAVREVEEECGIAIESVGKELPSSYHIYELKGKLALKRTYWFEMTYSGTESLTPQTEEDILNAEWLGKNEFEKVLTNTYPAIKLLLQGIE